MASEASPGTKKIWVFQKPFRRLAKREELLRIASTTGTFDVHRCCEPQSCFRTDLGLQWAWTLMMSEGSAKRDNIFGCFIVSMSPETSPDTEKTWIFQQPFWRLAECNGLESIADTTGALDVYRCWETLNLFSDSFGISRNQDIKKVGLRPTISAKHNRIFGCSSVSMFSEASPGTEETWLFQ